jgi:hypothetical protein
MKILQINQETAKRLYPTASAEFKALLEENFTKQELSGDIMDFLGKDPEKAYKNACEYIDIKPGLIILEKADGTTEYLTEAEMLQRGFRQDDIDRRKLELLTYLLNDCEYLDWNNSDQAKYYPWFKFLAPSGFAFRATSYYCSAARAGDASRLCFKDEKRARFAGENYLALYRSIIDNKPTK